MSITAVPLAFAVPAAVSYLAARWRIPVDWTNIVAHARTLHRSRKRIADDRINLFYVLEEHAQDRKVANQIFLIYHERRYTFKQVYQVVLRYAGWLHDTHKVAPRETIALDFVNCPEFLFLVLAIWSLGAVPALINYNLTGDPLVHSVKSSNARLLIVEADLESKALNASTRKAFLDPNFRQGALPLEVVVFNHEVQTSVENFPQHRAPDSARSAQVGRETAVLISTSGTTGLPKQSIIPWFRLFGAGHYAATWQSLRSATRSHPDRVYTSMPLYHSSAFIFGFGMCLVNATTLVLSRKFSISKFWSEVVASEATVIQYVGETLRYLVNAPVQPDEKTRHKVRIAFGNGLRPDVWKKFKARFGIDTIAEFYAATEGVGASMNLNRNDFSDGAIGQTGLITEFLVGRSQAIVQVDWESESPWRDPHTKFCQRLPRGEPGELLFKLDAADVDATFQGYLNNKKASESKILRNVFEKGDAWFRTGDVIKWDKEGRLWFSDRIGDTFRWKSENVSTAEVGEVIGYHPQVQEANVYGVKVPGHEGRAGCAAVQLRRSALVGKNNIADEGDATEVKPEVLESLATFATNSLPRFGVPVFLRVVQEMTTTGNNKPQKHPLRSQGVDVDAVSQSGDRLYWLRPGADRYEPFNKQDLESLTAGTSKL